MARPKLSNDKKLSKLFIFRLTEKELALLRQIADTCGKPPGVVARAKLFNGRYPRPKLAKLDAETFIELKKIGVNINQIAKKANTGILNNTILRYLDELLAQQKVIIKLLFDDSKSEDR